MSDKPKGRTPDYIVKAIDKRTDWKGRIGVGWSNPGGGITIVLDPLVVLHGSDREIVVTIFPNDYDPEIAKTYRDNKRKVADAEAKDDAAS